MQDLKAPKRRAGVALSDYAVEAIRGWIVEGDLTPGTPLVEARLAARLGISRVPVREALQRLSEQGLVRAEQGRTATVAPLDPQEMLEIFAVREVLEGLVLRLACLMATDDDLAELQRMVEDGRKACRDRDWEQVGRINVSFHRRLAELCNNRHAQRMIDDLRYKLSWLNRGLAAESGLAAWDEHEAIVSALARGDAEEAERLGRAHMAGSRALFLRQLAEGRLPRR